MLHFKLIYNFDISGAHTKEVIGRYLRGGNQVFMCLYNLQKAFDLVEYPVFVREVI